jgi:ElaB/YqjD/DUF883 family membrane-anchored ribosome-binding protein
MGWDSTRLQLEEVARDLDMLVYELEGSPAEDGAEAETEEVRLRRRRRFRVALESVRDRIQDMADAG